MGMKEKFILKIISFILVFYSILYTGLAFSATGKSTGLVRTILWYEGHSGALIAQDGMSDLGGCGRSDLYILDDQHPYFKEMYALILAAHIANQSLEFTIDGCKQGISRIKHVASIK